MKPFHGMASIPAKSSACASGRWRSARACELRHSASRVLAQVVGDLRAAACGCRKFVRVREPRCSGSLPRVCWLVGASKLMSPGFGGRSGVGQAALLR
jgi:hypothetical protein